MTRLTLKVKAGVPQHLDAGDNPDFETWYKRVDAFLWKGAGCGADDLEDMPWMRWYTERRRPIRAANLALKRAGADTGF